MQQSVLWRQTRWGLLLLGALELAAAYGETLVALNSGAIWEYGLAAIFCVDGIRRLARLIWNVAHGHKTADA